MDVDGTILTPEGALTPRMLRAARLAHERGVTLALATARRWTGAEPIARALGAVRPLILYDGALRRGFPDGAVEAVEPLASDVAREAAGRIVAAGLRVVAQYSLSAGERMVATAETPHGEWMESYLAMFTQQVRYRPLDTLLTVFQKPLRLVSFGPIETLRALVDSLADLPVGRQILPVGSYGVAELTVFAPGVSKGAALTRLAADLGVPVAETHGDWRWGQRHLDAARGGPGRGDGPRGAPCARGGGCGDRLECGGRRGAGHRALRAG